MGLNSHRNSPISFCLDTGVCYGVWCGYVNKTDREIGA